jgi:pilus assembly protein Flp/PilA
MIGGRVKKINRDRIVDLAFDESGQDIIEYAMIAAVIGLGVVASMSTVTQDIGSMFNNIEANF